ncbi:TRAP transporter substrate-binding protein [Pontivivens insulae]|uniref:Solute-binding protein n=1 Tax=Pontivivens insulae TaxID=1639689 RepID=A0A2R8A7E0_9RHOB|nr:TRAP transporter substrate-binding protein [Pontivivens insulae]RED18253.1 TRAP-type C4-dicarboxylate transport system substrate-binding protein [Pontivivens insulae]SPF28151.1 Solute-binding protein [Pontivivens insulae]
MKRKSILGAVSAAAMLALSASTAAAQEYTLKLHQFLPAQANVPASILDVWADNVEEASEGRIEIERYPSMQLGGTPPGLMDQAIDGVADIIWTVVGYTPGRFPSTEVFELPFFVEDAGAASSAFWQMYETRMQEEFSDVHILGTWVHGPGVIHAAEPVEVPSDMNGLKIRGASRQVNALLQELGAEPVGMPVPAVPEALSRGVIDGTTIPWEVTGALRTSELVEFHTEFTGNMLYTVTFVLAMNNDAYAELPADLQQVIDDNSGLEFSIFAGNTMVAFDGPARDIAVENGNEIFTLDEAQSALWAETAQPVYAAWLADMEERGIDGQALIDEARALMDAYEPAE